MKLFNIKIKSIIEIIITIIIIIYAYIGAYKIHYEQTEPRIIEIHDTIYSNIDLGNLYNLSINHLKSKEGLCLKPTISCDGLLTIGYGHVIKKNETFTGISEMEATILLKKDLQTAIDFVKKHTDLKDNKALAMGLLAFNIGTGKFLKYVKNDSLLVGNNIEKIKNYCHYHTKKDGKDITITSKALLDRRLFELKIYQNKF